MEYDMIKNNIISVGDLSNHVYFMRFVINVLLAVQKQSCIKVIKFTIWNYSWLFGVLFLDGSTVILASQFKLSEVGSIRKMILSKISIAL